MPRAQSGSPRRQPRAGGARRGAGRDRRSGALRAVGTAFAHARVTTLDAASALPALQLARLCAGAPLPHTAALVRAMPVLVARRAAARTAASDAVVVASPATVVVADVAVRPKEAAVGDTSADGLAIVGAALLSGVAAAVPAAGSAGAKAAAAALSAAAGTGGLLVTADGTGVGSFRVVRFERRADLLALRRLHGELLPHMKLGEFKAPRRVMHHTTAEARRAAARHAERFVRSLLRAAAASEPPPLPPPLASFLGLPAGVDLALGRGEPAENAGDGSVGGGGGELGGGGTARFAAFLNARGTDEAPPPLDAAPGGRRRLGAAGGAVAAGAGGGGRRRRRSCARSATHLRAGGERGRGVPEGLVRKTLFLAHNTSRSPSLTPSASGALSAAGAASRGRFSPQPPAAHLARAALLPS